MMSDSVNAAILADPAGRPSLQQPHTLIFFLAAMLCVATIVLLLLFVKRDRSWERRVYWTGTFGAVVCAFLAALPYWKYGVGAVIFGVALMTFGAYAYTPYIKIRGKIYAFWLPDSLPDPPPGVTAAPGSDDPAPDSYGGLVTARKHWWAAIFTVAFFGCLLLIRADDKPWWLTPAAAAILVTASFGYGYIDASWGYSIARGQRLQFVIIAIITAGAFTLLYVVGYYAGKRWPPRRKQSMEYRAHPRHQKRYP
jgi:hypothetical protein